MQTSSQPWTCIKCLTRQKASRRGVASAAAASNLQHIAVRTPSILSSPRKDSDDRTLRRIFDSRAFWLDFSKSGRTGLFRSNVGLFQNKYLKSPDGYEDFTRITLERCRKLVSKILAINSLDGYRAIVKDMDRLSDLLCRIIDVSDFVRSTHPDPSFQRAASQAHVRMFEYMMTLNTTTGLNNQLKTALSDPEVRKSWSEEEVLVAQILHKDFSQSAIDLPAAQRQRFVGLSNNINELGSRFIDNMAAERSHIQYDIAQLKGMNPVLLQRLANSKGKVKLPTMGPVAMTALRTVENDAIRKELYIASRTAAQGQIYTLEELLRHRAELAKLSGYSSFASMSLVDKMAKSPQAVVEFLEALLVSNSKDMKVELEELQKFKALSSHSSPEIHPWDREFYRHRITAQSRLKSRHADFLPAYFSLGSVMQGLSRLFDSLYGVRFIAREPQPGETWDPDVRRLDVVDENDGHIAVVYCDLFARPGKSPNPAHFTLRCSRLIEASEVEELALPDSSVSMLEPRHSANDGMAISTPSESGCFYQLPTIALICDFSSPSPSQSHAESPTLLHLSSVKTLFHEMGHAIHSILGRTKLQNVSGTRCPTDFAELPSVLMEHFAVDPSVLQLFARHWETDAPLPLALLDHHETADTAGAAFDTETQIPPPPSSTSATTRPPPSIPPSIRPLLPTPSTLATRLFPTRTRRAGRASSATSSATAGVTTRTSSTAPSRAGCGATFSATGRTAERSNAMRASASRTRFSAGEGVAMRGRALAGCSARRVRSLRVVERRPWRRWADGVSTIDGMCLGYW